MSWTDKIENKCGDKSLDLNKNATNEVLFLNNFPISRVLMLSKDRDDLEFFHAKQFLKRI